MKYSCRFVCGGRSTGWAFALASVKVLASADLRPVCRTVKCGLFIDIKCLQNRLLNSVPSFKSFILLQQLTVLIKQTRQAVCTVKQSILFRCLWGCYSYSCILFKKQQPSLSLINCCQLASDQIVNVVWSRFDV